MFSVGYILPISHFEYTDYQRRTIKDKETLHYIEKPYKITMDMEQQFMYELDLAKQTMRNKDHTPFAKIKVVSPAQDQLIANITGKGSLFNQII